MVNKETSSSNFVLTKFILSKILSFERHKIFMEEKRMATEENMISGNDYRNTWRMIEPYVDGYVFN